jgi:hypothetical protein
MVFPFYSFILILNLNPISSIHKFETMDSAVTPMHTGACIQFSVIKIHIYSEMELP